jgi:hypothetical protein
MTKACIICWADLSHKKCAVKYCSKCRVQKDLELRKKYVAKGKQEVKERKKKLNILLAIKK